MTQFLIVKGCDALSHVCGCYLNYIWALHGKYDAHKYFDTDDFEYLVSNPG